MTDIAIASSIARMTMRRVSSVIPAPSLGRAAGPLLSAPQCPRCALSWTLSRAARSHTSQGPAPRPAPAPWRRRAHHWAGCAYCSYPHLCFFERSEKVSVIAGDEVVIVIAVDDLPSVHRIVLGVVEILPEL